MALIEDINLPKSVSVITLEDVTKERITTNAQKTKGPRHFD